MGGYSVPISEIAGGIVNPAASVLTRCRFRFIVCSDLIDNGHLTVVEHPNLPNDYAALSYPWNGLKPCEGDSIDESAFFRVNLEGGHPSDGISIAVLRTACLAARQHNANLLWVDQICILQTDADDKAWQIQRMFELYQRCGVSLVFPGGLQRLAGHDEGTNWIERSWTLQEAMPEVTFVVFRWLLGSGEVSGLTQGRVWEVERGRSALMKLGAMLQAASVPQNFFCGGAHKNVTIRTAIFGSHRDPIVALMAVKEAKSIEMREMAVWRSALLRTCSVPRDMILSIMGIFGVKLEVERYGTNDRDKAAADLAYGIVGKGGNASWLGAAPGCAVSSSVCSMPEFPLVDGREAWYCDGGILKRPWEVMGIDLYWYIKPTSSAAIPDERRGGLNLTAQTLRVKLGSSVRLEPSHPNYHSWPRFDFKAPLKLDEDVELGRNIDNFYLSRALPQGDYQALVLGLIEHFALPATGARGARGAALLAILRWSSAGKTWEILTYGMTTCIDDVARTWPRCTLSIGC
jgi:hypothetical protein